MGNDPGTYVSNVGDVTFIRIDRPIDHDLDLKSLIGDRTGAVVIDLDGAKAVTSSGIQRWRSAMRDSKVSFLGIIRARPAVVTQYSLVAGFGGHSVLLSLYAPYLCDSCGFEEEHLHDVVNEYEHLRRFQEPPHPSCGQCGASTELDDLPEHYFGFLAEHQKPNPPNAVSAAIGSYLSGPKEHLSAPGTASDLASVAEPGESQR